MGVMQSFGWATAAVLFVVLVVQDAVRQRAARVVNAALDGLEGWVSGSRWARARSIRRYRQRVAERFSQVPVPFKLPVEIPMSSVYIPLRASDRLGKPGGQSGELGDEPASLMSDTVDLETAAASHRRVLVLGEPGSGKSLFLQYLLWSSSRDEERRGRRRAHRDSDRPLAVLVRLTDVAKSGDITAEITTSLERHGFTNPETWVRRELDRVEPNLRVLLDGLDEVGSQQRWRVTEVIRSFADSHPHVRFIVTCRQQVYGGALDGLVDHLLYIQPFTDELIERFLHAWPPMTSAGAADRLVVALGETPQVGVLARNPLVLTTLAYLYTAEYEESPDLLPHNRTLFYSDVTELLLRRWQEGFNKYKWVPKKVVLQHLALLNQCSDADRRGLGRYQSVLAAISEVLPRTGYKAEDAPAVLDEIVERSGLLVALDGGERYQFAHLTMQEYLAAQELQDRPEELLRHYRDDPEGWREPVKLWCGGKQDSTRLIREIAEHDRVLALECLADANVVDDAFAQELIESAKEDLMSVGRGPASGSTRSERRVFGLGREAWAITRAFGLLAADHQRPRGRAVLDYLVQETRSGENPTSPAVALAASKLPEAAETLAQRASEEIAAPLRTWYLSLLESMGNVAVPAVADVVDPVSNPAVPASLGLAAVETLTAIGTPRAAQALAQLLWHAELAIARRAAMGLAQHSTSPPIEDALVRVDLPEPAHILEGQMWVWEPFVQSRPETERRNLQLIFGQAGLLFEALDDADFESIQRALDARLVLAALLFSPYGTPRCEGEVEIGQDELVVDSPLLSETVTLSEDGVTVSDAGSLSEIELTGSREERLLGGLASLVDLDPRLVQKSRPDGLRDLVDRSGSSSRLPAPRQKQERWPWPRLQEWRTMYRSTQAFQVDGSLYHRVPFVCVVLVALASLPFAWSSLASADGWGRLGYGSIFASLVVSLVGLVFLDDELIPSVPGKGSSTLADCWAYLEAAVIIILASLVWPFVVWMWLSGDDDFSFEDALLFSPFAGFTISCTYGLTIWISPAGAVWSLGTLIAFVGLMVALVLIGYRKERESRRQVMMQDLYKALTAGRGGGRRPVG